MSCLVGECTSLHSRLRRGSKESKQDGEIKANSCKGEAGFAGGAIWHCRIISFHFIGPCEIFIKLSRGNQLDRYKKYGFPSTWKLEFLSASILIPVFIISCLASESAPPFFECLVLHVC